MTKFMKGQSGNPAGRPREIGDLREMARKRTEQALETLTEVMLDKAAPPSARVTAANSILDRGFGRPSQEIIQKSDETPLLSVEEAAKRIAFAINKAQAKGITLDGDFAKLM